MNNILVLNSSVLGDQSVSKVLVEDAVQRLSDGSRNATVVRRDLGTTPIPHLTTATVAGVRGVPATEAELAARALSDELIAELQAADTLVIGAPMYNFSIPTGLRAWFDYVLRPGKTFTQQTRAAWSRNVTPGSVSAAPRVVRETSCTPRCSSKRNSRRLTIDLDTPRRRAPGETPPASATATKVCRSSRSIRGASSIG